MRVRRTTPHGRRLVRKGSFTLELLFVLPILMSILLGTIEFSLFGLARQQVVAASREGARTAALGGNSQEVQQAVQQYLGNGALANATVQASLTDALGNPIPSGQPVQVTVSLPANQAVPDLLAFIGFSIKNETIAAQTVMRKE
jgi:Flp pilus assembly protein TadG